MTSRYDEPGESLDGSPRSVFELRFVAAMRPCKHCGQYSDVEWSTTRLGDGKDWRTEGACARCGKWRAYWTRSDLDLPEIQPPLYELGGPEPSTLMTATDLVREIERITPGVVGPNRAPDQAAAWARLERLQTAVNELAKFLDGDTIPSLGSADRARYDRSWIASERARLAALEDS